MREPSVHSVSSTSSSTSEISSEASSAIHRRSTPKIAAVIIAAFVVIAALIAVTVYLVNSNNFSDTDEVANGDNNVGDGEEALDTSVDYRTYHDETSRLLKEGRISPDQIR